MGHPLANQQALIGLQLRKGEPGIGSGFAFDCRLQFIRRAADLRTFRHTVILLLMGGAAAQFTIHRLAQRHGNGRFQRFPHGDGRHTRLAGMGRRLRR